MGRLTAMVLWVYTGWGRYRVRPVAPPRGEIFHAGEMTDSETNVVGFRLWVI